MVPASLLLLACAGSEDPAHLRLPSVPEPSVVATGEVTWTAVFDEDATAAGAVDCTYTRTYRAMEDRSTPWLCPDCDVVLSADITMSEEGRECFLSVAGSSPSDEERIGWDETRLMRAGSAFAPLIELGLRTDEAAINISDGGTSNVVTFAGVSEPLALAEGTVQLWIEGGFETGIVIGDPWNGMSPPPSYRCGWPVLDPPAYDGPWRIAVGEQAPDGWFRDACDEPVRLHDLAGRYIVIDMAAVDCAPCQSMAAGERAFSAEVHALGIDVQGVTLLVRSLDDPLTPADADLLDDWRDTFELGSVVLGDRGWGYAMSSTLWPETLSYPSWFVLSPSYEVLAAGQGYAGWDDMKAVIVDHWRP
jgi:hypothetical protein